MRAMLERLEKSFARGRFSVAVISAAVLDCSSAAVYCFDGAESAGVTERM